MRKSDKGFTLYYTDTASRLDKYVYFITEKRGVFLGAAVGAKKGKNRFGGSLEPFNEVEIIIYEKENYKIPIIENVNLLKNNIKIFNDIDIYNHLLCIAEIIVKLTPPEIKQEKLLRLIKAFINALENNKNIEKLFNYFLIWFLRIEGLLPEFKTCAICKKSLNNQDSFYLSNDGTEIFCSSCKKENCFIVPSSFLLFLELSEYLSPSKFNNVEITNQNKIKKLLINMINLYGEKQLCSLKMLI